MKNLNNNTTSTNNTIKEEKNVMNINKKAGKNVIEIVKEITNTGVSVEYFYINGVKAGIVGVTSEYDRQAFLRTVQTAVDDCDSTNTYEIINQVGMLMMIMAEYNENNIVADEQVSVDGVDCVIDYNSKSIYTIDGVDKLADMEDIETSMPIKAVKAILVERAKSALR